MRRRQDHFRLIADEFCDLFGEFPHRLARLGKFAEQRSVISERIENLLVPAMRPGVHHARGRSVGVFLFLHARQAEMKVIGEHQKALRPVQAPAPLVVKKLVHRIERLVLNARTRIQLGIGHLPVHRRNGALCPPVAVTIHAVDRPVLSVQEHIIHSPGVHAHGSGNLVHLSRFFQAVEDFGKQAVRIPHQTPVPLRAQRAGRSRKRFRAVGKTVNLFRHHLPAFQMRENMTAGGRADIDCKIIFHVHSLSGFPDSFDFCGNIISHLFPFVYMCPKD